jgi:hypothetical protein
MSRKRQNITLPADLIIDARIFANAKIVYAVLKTFRKNNVKFDSPFSPSLAAPVPSVTLTHCDHRKKRFIPSHGGQIT